MLKRSLYILTLLPSLAFSQLYVGNSALLHISEDARFEVGPDLQNLGEIQNNGLLVLYRNWTINNRFNGLEGTLIFQGSEDIRINPRELTLKELIINQIGDVNFPGDEYIITERLEFRYGKIIPGNDTRFVLDRNARVIGGSNDSYYEGTITHVGSGVKTFPVGNEGLYAPLTLTNVIGASSEISVNFNKDNLRDPLPADSLIGVSGRGLWEVELTSGVTEATRVAVEFSEEDLSDFRVSNNIRNRRTSPVLAQANNPEGPFVSLGVRSLTDTDSLTFGTLTTEEVISPQLRQKLYLALALAPRIPESGLYFIPEAFSPQAGDARNRTFRIFGSRIVEEGFSLQIYNRLGSEVYATTSFTEANQIGWNGNHQRTGKEEPTGLYYYSLRFQFQSGEIIEKNGGFYLVR